MKFPKTPLGTDEILADDHHHLFKFTIGIFWGFSWIKDNFWGIFERFLGIFKDFCGFFGICLRIFNNFQRIFIFEGFLLIKDKFWGIFEGFLLIKDRFWGIFEGFLGVSLYHLGKFSFFFWSRSILPCDCWRCSAWCTRWWWYQPWNHARRRTIYNAVTDFPSCWPALRRTPGLRCCTTRTHRTQSLRIPSLWFLCFPSALAAYGIGSSEWTNVICRPLTSWMLPVITTPPRWKPQSAMDWRNLQPAEINFLNVKFILLVIDLSSLNSKLKRFDWIICWITRKLKWMANRLKLIHVNVHLYDKFEM